jgi:hypothetical protein
MVAIASARRSASIHENHERRFMVRGLVRQPVAREHSAWDVIPRCAIGRGVDEGD